MSGIRKLAANEEYMLVRRVLREPVEGTLEVVRFSEPYMAVVRTTLEETSSHSDNDQADHLLEGAEEELVFLRLDLVEQTLQK